MIDVQFWERVYAVGRIVRVLNGYKAFNKTTLSVGDDGRFRLTVRSPIPKQCEEFAIEGVIVCKDKNSTYTLQLWGATTLHRLTTEYFNDEQSLLNNLTFRVSSSTAQDERRKKKAEVKKAEEKKEIRVKRGKPVICVETGKVFRSGNEASRQIGVSSHYVPKACRQGFAVRGYHYQYKETENGKES